jgi:hypothetical protein
VSGAAATLPTAPDTLPTKTESSPLQDAVWRASQAVRAAREQGVVTLARMRMRADEAAFHIELMQVELVRAELRKEPAEAELQALREWAAIVRLLDTVNDDPVIKARLREIAGRRDG